MGANRGDRRFKIKQNLKNAKLVFQCSCPLVGRVAQYLGWWEIEGASEIVQKPTSLQIEVKITDLSTLILAVLLFVDEI